MDISECMRQAIRDGSYNKATFTLVGTDGSRINCKMLDAHFGMFTVKGNDGGFLRDNQVPEGFYVSDYNPSGGAND